MSYKIEFTKSSRADIRKAVSYIKNELHNRAAAERLVLAVHKVAESLTEMPFRHPLISDDYLAQQGYRWVLVHNYMLFYVVFEKTKMVYIDRLFHGSRNWTFFLKENTQNFS